jgi:hypothetical protein
VTAGKGYQTGLIQIGTAGTRILHWTRKGIASLLAIVMPSGFGIIQGSGRNRAMS